VYFPEQDIIEGTIQIAVIEGASARSQFKTTVTIGFPTTSCAAMCALRPGDVVIQDRLNSDLNWLNQNTFQSVGNGLMVIPSLAQLVKLAYFGGR